MHGGMHDTTTTTTTITTHHDHSSWFSSSSHLLCGDDDMGMVMYMDGFRWTLRGDTENNGGCLNLLFASWRLNTVPRFLLAMVGVFALGIATEGIRRWRHELSVRQQQQQQQQQQQEQPPFSNASTTSTIRRQRRFRALQQVCLQGLGLLSAYLLMLVVMTYSYELLSCVIGGLVAGYCWFDNDLLQNGGGGGGTPCCNSLLETGPAAGGRDAATAPTEADLLAEPLLPRTTTSATDEDDHAEQSCCHNDAGYGATDGEEGI